MTAFEFVDLAIEIANSRDPDARAFAAAIVMHLAERAAMPRDFALGALDLVLREPLSRKPIHA